MDYFLGITTLNLPYLKQAFFYELLILKVTLEQNYNLVMSSRNIDRTCLGKKDLHLNPNCSG